MTRYSVYDKTTGEHMEIDTLAKAKKWIKTRINLGHDAGGDKTKVYSNGEWIPCGPISLTTSNKTLIVNSKMSKANY